LSKIPSLAILAVACGGIAGFGASAVATAAVPQVKISQEQARAIALKQVPGQVINAELERENGSWRFSFDIRLNGDMHEVGIDADNGIVVENSLAAPSKHD